ncbi:MAG: circularly permuted type 2 ATP-grasp protein, partial [Alphaproteobacteria bacterium]|nr:circularly permuted type 2 ATP-grasp protein [Alphaproteobacteria bacterium]
MTNAAIAPAVEPASLLASYRPINGVYDELLDQQGQMRHHWAPLMDGLAKLSYREMMSRSNRLDRQVRETGLAHNIFADPDGAEQQWRLNMMPLVISADEWRWLETAIDQRARLLNALLADIYGAQETLRSGAVPAELIFADPAFLRGAMGVVPESGYLQFYAADLARAPDGRWCVIDSHTETVAGIGYAIANRMMHDDVAGDLFMASNARRLAPYFKTLKAGLNERTGRSDPTIGLLSRGGDHDDYFSHAYLARYLGFLLVEGGDLRVMGDEVFLKTLEGLKQVDLLVRCIEGSRSDPLELDPAGFDGPPGLLQAFRTNPQLVCNGIGAAIVENRGLTRYLPGLCQSLLGEELLLADAPGCWLGEAGEQAAVAASLDDWIIRPAREGIGRPGQAILGRWSGDMSAAERDLLVDDIRMHGPSLVAEERTAFGTMPTLTEHGLQPRRFGMRIFSARGASGFNVMPGGLAMVVANGAAAALSASDGYTHDVWVLSDQVQRPHASLWQPHLNNALVHRTQRSLQSRVADNLFWLGRYLERADWTMRVIRSALAHRFDHDAGAGTRYAGDVCLELLLQGDVNGATAATDGLRTTQLARLLVAGGHSSYCLETSFKGISRIAN